MALWIPDFKVSRGFVVIYPNVVLYHFLTVISICGWLSCCPVRPDWPGSQPLSIHEGDGVLGLGLLREWHEPVAFRLERLRVANHSAITEKISGLSQDFQTKMSNCPIENQCQSQRVWSQERQNLKSRREMSKKIGGTPEGRSPFLQTSSQAANCYGGIFFCQTNRACIFTENFPPSSLRCWYLLPLKRQKEGMAKNWEKWVSPPFLLV